MVDFFEKTDKGIQLREDVKSLGFASPLFTLKYNYAPTLGDHDGRERRRGKAEAEYVYWMYSFGSAFADYDEGNRKSSALKQAKLPDDYKISKELEAFIKEYIKHQENGTSIRLVKAAKKTIHNLTEHLEEVNFLETDESGKLKYDISKYSALITKLPELLSGLNKLEEAVKLELQEAKRIRGGGKKGLREDPRRMG